jgi:hypothetical protein
MLQGGEESRRLTAGKGICVRSTSGLVLALHVFFEACASGGI